MGQSGSSYPLYDLSWPQFTLHRPCGHQIKEPWKNWTFRKCGYFPPFHVFCNISVTFYDLDLVDPSWPQFDPPGHVVKEPCKNWKLVNVDISLYFNALNVDIFKISLILVPSFWLHPSWPRFDPLTGHVVKNSSKIEYKKNENVYSTKSVWARSIKPSLRFRSRFYEL